MDMEAQVPAQAKQEIPTYSLWQLVGYFLYLGTLGFGGPVALVGYMHRDLVERRGWIREADYQEGLALAQLAPGPLAAQLAIYLGYIHYHLLGATLVGLVFVLPSFIMVVLLGWAYTLYGGLSWMQAVFYGVGASVIGIIAQSAYRLTSKTIGRDWLLWAIFLVSAITTILTETENILLIIGAGLLTWLVKAPPKRWGKIGRGTIFSVLPLSLVLAVVPPFSVNLLLSMFFLFATAGAFVFGSGLAIVPFLYGSLVQDYGWLTNQQFVDAVAVAMITPGPVVITVGFIGYLVAGLPGASIAALGTFLPCYLLTILPMRWFRRYGKHPIVNAWIIGITAAATGAIAGAVVVLGRRSITDLPTILFALLTLLVLWKWKRLPEPVVIGVVALVSLIVYPLVHR